MRLPLWGLVLAAATSVLLRIIELMLRTAGRAAGLAAHSLDRTAQLVRRLAR